MDKVNQATTPAGLWGRLLAGRDARKRRRRAAHDLYGEVVQAARRPVFYADCGVPDTADGRLEMIGLHAALVMRRLRDLGAEGREAAQALFDLMFADVDRSLREQGVGDLSVGKHVKRAAQTFFARAQALEAALEAKERETLAAVLARNLFTSGGAPPEPQRVAGLARYVEALDRALGVHDRRALLEGRLQLPRETIEVDSSRTTP